MVRTFIRRKGEEQSREVDLNKINMVLTLEIAESSKRVKGFNFERKEDKDCAYQSLPAAL